MYRTFGISLAMKSQAHARKSENMISATGRTPDIAAPIAAPTIACSLIGVSQTRLAPNSSKSPCVVLKTPPAAPMSSPMHTTDGSRRISRAMPSETASRYVVSSATGSLRPPTRR